MRGVKSFVSAQGVAVVTDGHLQITKLDWLQSRNIVSCVKISYEFIWLYGVEWNFNFKHLDSVLNLCYLLLAIISGVLLWNISYESLCICLCWRVCRCRLWCNTDQLQATGSEVASRKEFKIGWSFSSLCISIIEGGGVFGSLALIEDNFFHPLIMHVDCSFCMVGSWCTADRGYWQCHKTPYRLHQPHWPHQRLYDQTVCGRLELELGVTVRFSELIWSYIWCQCRHCERTCRCSVSWLSFVYRHLPK